MIKNWKGETPKKEKYESTPSAKNSAYLKYYKSGKVKEEIGILPSGHFRGREEVVDNRCESTLKNVRRKFG